MAPRKLRCVLVVCIALFCLGVVVNAYDEPYVNPLGDLDAYTYTEFIPLSERYAPWDFGYWDADDEYYPLDIWGDTWVMEVSEKSLKSLGAYLETLDANIITSTNELLIAQLDSSEGVWWVRGSDWGDEYYELIVIAEQEPPEYEDENYDQYYYDESEFIVPLINPLTDQSAYLEASRQPADSFELNYYNALGEAINLHGWGETWFFRVPIEDHDQPWLSLEKYILNLGGTITENSQGMLNATVIDKDSNKWQAIAQLSPEENSYTLDVTKELLLEANKTITITPQPDHETIGLVTYSDGLKHKSLAVQLSNGLAYLNAEMTTTYDEYQCTWDRWIPIYHERTPLYVLDHIAQEPGKTIWTLRFEPDAIPKQITLTLTESVPLPPLAMGSQLGVLRIRGANVGEVAVQMSHDMEVYHPDFSEAVGDLTSEGDYVFYLPAGYWDVLQTSPGFSTIRSRMVPVSSGQLTVFTMPVETQAIYEELPDFEVSDAFELNRHIIQGPQGAFDFVLTTVSEGVIPNITNSQVSEGGLMGDIISIEPVVTPPDIVLLLDSSGSMRAQMEQTLATAREFISSLSDDTFIQVIDFDTTPKLLAGTNKTDVLSSLNSVRADGATCLYDSVLNGLSLLETKQRPILVAFTDGVDANWDDTGPGSVATLPQVIEAVQAKHIPLYTIGFGSGHDKTVLQQLADISTGRYYPAADQNALNQVFTSINESLSNTYHLVYQRPEEPTIADVPVVSIMVDVSGSMDLPPEEGDDCNYRMQKVKNILHDFVLGLPEQTLIQIQSFSWGTNIDQSLTLDKASALSAIGAFTAQGATDTLGSIQVAYKTLSATPSKNKTLVYITDAAIAVEETEGNLDLLLAGIAASDIKVIWMGIGLENAQAIFENVAEKSHGRYIVTEDHNKLAAVLDEVLTDVKQTVADSSSVQVRLATKQPGSDNGQIKYTGVLAIPYMRLAQSDQVIGPEMATYYGTGTAAGIKELQAFGLADDNLSTRYIPLDATGANTAMDMQVTGATVNKVIAGLKAPYGQQFISIDLKLDNILEAQQVEIDDKGNNHPANWMGSVGSNRRTEFKVPQYLITSLSSHLYLGWNNNSLYPISKASWIVPNNLLAPGDISLTLQPTKTLTGTLVFLVDEQPISQMSLHFYDSAYGHFTVDLMGVSEHSELQLESLPTQETSRLSEVFELKVTAVNDVTEIGSIVADKLNVFRIIELDLTSKVQSLLDIDPLEVFSLRIVSDYGVFFVPLHPLTKSVPFGFSDARMVAPGSFNKVRFVFEIPEALAANTSELFVDLRSDDVIIPLTNAPAQLEEPCGIPLIAKGIELYVNQVGWVKELQDYGVNYVVADLTFVDAPDGFGTQLVNAFTLVRDDYTGISSEVDITELVTQGDLDNFTSSGEIFYEVLPGDLDANFTLEFDDAVVKDGMPRRVLLVFEIPLDDEEHQWTLRSNVFTDLKHALPPEKEYPQIELLGYRTVPRFNLETADFDLKLDLAVNNAIREYQALQAATGNLKTQERMDLLGVDDQEVTIAPPQATISGTLALDKIASEQELLVFLEKIKWLPSADRLFHARYAPEAVVTQMWGNEADITGLAETVLRKLGYKPQLSMVELTEAGLSALATKAQIPEDNITNRQLPALKYQDNGTDKLLVLPFGADFSELKEYVAIPMKRIEAGQLTPLVADITVSFNVIPSSGGIGNQFADFASILGGSDEDEGLLRHILIEAKIPLTELSKDPIDLVYMWAGDQSYTAVLETPQGRFIGEDVLDTTEYEIIGATIEIEVQDFFYTHNFVLEQGQQISEVAHTIAINLPDLPQEVAQQLQQIATNLHESTDRPDSFSVLQWYTRNIINRFLVAHTEAEYNLATTMDLVIGRTHQPRVIVVTVEGDAVTNKINSSINLLNAANDIHNGDQLTQSAFSIGAGLMASSIEAQALGDGIGVFELWAYLPHDATMLWIDNYNRSTALEVLAAAGFNRTVQRRVLEAEDKVIIIPLERIRLNGALRTAWLEIDPETYFTIGVIDTGENGAMIEAAVQDLLKQFTKHSVGAFLGVHSMVLSFSN